MAKLLMSIGGCEVHSTAGATRAHPDLERTGPTWRYGKGSRS